MATVYLAEDLKHQRKVEIKVLRSELAAGPHLSPPAGTSSAVVTPLCHRLTMVYRSLPWSPASDTPVYPR
jgi:hypothetical protein